MTAAITAKTVCVVLILFLLSGWASATELVYEDFFSECGSTLEPDTFGCALHVLVPNLHFKAATNLVYTALYDATYGGAQEFFTTISRGIDNVYSASLGDKPMAMIVLIKDAIVGMLLVVLKFGTGLASAFVVMICIYVWELTKTYIEVGLFIMPIYQIMRMRGIIDRKENLSYGNTAALMMLLFFIGSVAVLTYDAPWGWLTWF